MFVFCLSVRLRLNPLKRSQTDVGLFIYFSLIKPIYTMYYCIKSENFDDFVKVCIKQNSNVLNFYSVVVFIKSPTIQVMKRKHGFFY